LNPAGPDENRGVFREREPSKEAPKGFQASMEGKIGPPGYISGEEKTAE
jgi:hypothetical protein